MSRRMSVREVRARFADVLGSVYHTGEPVIVERNGKPVAVVISPEAFASSKPVRFRSPAMDRDRVQLPDLLAQAPVIRRLYERPPLKAQRRSIREMIALAREEVWASKRPSADG